MQPKHTIPGHELRGCSWFSEGLQQNILNLFCKKYIMAKFTTNKATQETCDST